jgi:hypothetical protein
VESSVVGRVERPVAAGEQRTLATAWRSSPVLWWASAGALVLAFIVFVLVRWVTGPWFATVHTGPSSPPTWMKATLIFFQVFAVVGTLALLYIYLVRPWRRDRVVSTDGLLVPVFFLIFFQDPLSSVFGDWFSWNAYLVNKGSWIYSVPGSQAYGHPGHEVVEPLLGGFLWVWIAFAGAWAGCFVLRRAYRRWPDASPVAMILCVLYPAMIVFDFIFEGLLTLPTGLYAYPGGHLSIWPGAYDKYPITEALFAGATLAALAAIRFFRNDRGETIAERGIHSLRIGAGAKVALRFLALVCATQVLTFVTYNLTQGWFVGAHSGTWPASAQRLSYFTVGLCGEGTTTQCPRDGRPLTSDNFAHRRPGAPVVRLARGIGGADSFAGPLIGSSH